MRISLISAASDNDVIGRDNDLPWHLPDDFRFFKRTTKGHHVIMGRRTWESRPEPLPKRVNVIVTSRVDYDAPGGTIVRSLAEGIELARAAGEDEAFVIGGTRLYAEAIESGLADRMYLTRVHAHIEGDATFPSFDATQWREVERIEHPTDERHAHAFTFLTYDRVRA